ncbi:MAG: carboxypeptidase regulatory-like domain-containing protein, partial [Acidobacteriota bacterium]
MVGATVTATQIETGQIRSATSDDKGMFQIVKLKPGTYKVKVENGGFAPQERTDLRTVSGQVVQLDFKLSVGSVNAQQTVNAGDEDAPAIDTTRTVVGGTITQREIEEIPNNSRNPLDLVLTLGGTSEEQLSTKDLAEDRSQNPNGTPLEQGNFSLSGGTAYSNNITIDGLDNNDDRSSRDRFQPSIESIAEVQVITNQFSAEYGRASGGRINIRTRAGGNKLRGRGFMFYRDDNFDANTWYNNSRDIPRPPLREIDPGFFISGPIVIPHLYNGHNRTFFAVGYEYLNLRDTTLIDTYIPVVPNPHYTLPTPNGTGQFCDNAVPTACPATAGFIAPYTQSYLTPNISNVLTARVDHKLFAGNDLTLGFQFARKHNRRTNGASTTRIENA